MSRLKIVMRLVGCGIVFLFAAFFLTYSVCFNDSHVAAMVRDTLALFCIVFVIFVWRSFKRLWREMEQWMASSPVWRVAKRSAGSDWCKAVAACAVGPAIPFYLTLSLLNQTVRRCRGLDEPYSLLKLDDCSPQVGVVRQRDARHINASNNACSVQYHNFTVRLPSLQATCSTDRERRTMSLTASRVFCSPCSRGFCVR